MHYIPENSYFQFISIYPRIRGLKILLRIILNIVFFFFVWKVGKKLERDKEFLKNRGVLRKMSTPSKMIKSNSNPYRKGAKGKQKKKLRRLQLLLKLMLRMMMSLDYVNVVSNTLLIFTSVNRGVSAFDCCVIIIDLVSITTFQLMIVLLYMRYKDQRT